MARFRERISILCNGKRFVRRPSNKRSQIIWNEATFTRYIKDPKASLPGTKMAFAGLRDAQQIKDLITYLHQFDGNSVRATQ